jgi:hypothetical protein
MSGPIQVRSSLDIKNNTYVVQNGFLFEYYPLVCKKTQRGNFLDIEISPGVLAEGVAMIDKKLYDVSLKDLVRRRIDVRKQRISEEPVREPRRRTRAKANDTVLTTASIVQLSADQQRPSSLDSDQVAQAADLAWQDQVGTLLETLHQKEGEEFEVTSATQSRQNYEDCSISSIFEDLDEDPDS